MKYIFITYFFSIISDAIISYKIDQTYSMFARWFQSGLINHDTVFSSHNKPAPVGLISPETNQRTGS